ncbi:MAG: hypothetical protein GX943_01215 [Candidatus Pacebacteria bacterium]|jgi:hypothetical protein|nr:hypothetical protein [Candidatus Paceibacterota bacterium]
MNKNKEKKNNIFFQLFSSLAWISFSTAVIIVASVAYNYLFQKEEGDNEQLVLSQILEDHQLNNMDSAGQRVLSIVESEDARAELIAKFLERHSSPMTPHDYYGQKLVEIADRHGLDFRLLPAIAMQESNLCRVTNSQAPNNCLGFGIHSRGTLDFEDYAAGFERAARELKQNYIDQGLDTVDLIESKYTPSSNGSWANSVNQWMAEIRYDDRDLGRSEKINSNVLEYAN